MLFISIIQKNDPETPSIYTHIMFSSRIDLEIGHIRYNWSLVPTPLLSLLHLVHQPLAACACVCVRARVWMSMHGAGACRARAVQCACAHVCLSVIDRVHTVLVNVHVSARVRACACARVRARVGSLPWIKKGGDPHLPKHSLRPRMRVKQR